MIKPNAIIKFTFNSHFFMSESVIWSMAEKPIHTACCSRINFTYEAPSSFGPTTYIFSIFY